ncbi:MAG TPA: hypothetical protein DDZ96_04810 [Porphyromonadaceae bacterium]|jgi:hypothetical protein|nr:hypothetical protein [Porphyromonadaceae bacterium]HBX20914.1 hypothetical protein [Porphyromonadaceae bacterium]HCM22375.1 hypothetical protein [Porphyromonadaceae bacterium]
MNWEKELITLFDDPLLENVRPLPPKITSDDRLVESFLEITQWVELSGTEPTDNSEDFKERILYRRLRSIRNDKDKKAYLMSFDTLHLLNPSIDVNK